MTVLDESNRGIVCEEDESHGFSTAGKGSSGVPERRVQYVSRRQSSRCSSDRSARREGSVNR